MAGRIRDDDITAVRDRSSLLDVLAEYGVQVKSAGSSHKALCPFHDEKSPSLSINPTTGLYHCFGCGEGGDVIDFVKKIDNLDFLEAVERLAERASIELRHEDLTGPVQTAEPSGPRRSKILEINRLAEQWFAQRLATDPEASIARSFLQSRAFTREHANRFTLGYAPRGWDHLCLYLASQNITDDDIVGSGLASQSKHGTVVDRFRGRLIWPIHDITGAPIGFGARKLHDDDNGPKYLNTPETRAYKKSQVLYGLDLARKDIASAGHAVIVEGYTDVMAAHISGVTTAVATCGTAFGEDHTKILRRVLSDGPTTETTFTFDGDSAGQKAALRAYELDDRMQSSTSVVIVPDGLDPCELRLRDGDSALRDLITTRSPLFEFVIKAAIAGQDLSSPTGRTTAMALAAPVLAQIKDGFLRGEYERTLAGRLGVPDSSMHKSVIQAGRTISAAPRGRTTPAAISHPTLTPAATETTNGPADTTGDQPLVDPKLPPPSDPVPDGKDCPPPTAPVATGPVAYPYPTLDNRGLWAEREVSKLSLQQPNLLHEHLPVLTGPDFSHPAYRDIIRLARMAHASSARGTHWVSFIRDHATNPTTSALIIELSVTPMRLDEPEPDYVKWLIYTLQSLRLQRAQDAVHTELRQADPTNAQARQDLFTRKKDNDLATRAIQKQMSTLNHWDRIS